MTEKKLPSIDSVEKKSNVSTCVFKNSAKLAYRYRDGAIYEYVFAPSDPHSVMEKTQISVEPEDKTDQYLDEAIEYYQQYDTVEKLAGDWSTLGDWITQE